MSNPIKPSTTQLAQDTSAVAQQLKSKRSSFGSSLKNTAADLANQVDQLAQRMLGKTPPTAEEFLILSDQAETLARKQGMPAELESTFVTIQNLANRGYTALTTPQLTVRATSQTVMATSQSVLALIQNASGETNTELRRIIKQAATEKDPARITELCNDLAKVGNQLRASGRNQTLVAAIRDFHTALSTS